MGGTLIVLGCVICICIMLLCCILMFNRFYKYDELSDRNHESRERISNQTRYEKYDKTFDMVYARIGKQIETKKSEFNNYRKKLLDKENNYKIFVVIAGLLYIFFVVLYAFEGTESILDTFFWLFFGLFLISMIVVIVEQNKSIENRKKK